ncbi:hypothetical protein [Rhizobium sp. BK377]|uniref:hypothetical protein n=1 Tax=Rhizobium sp. BK377 TaxID=2587058 RepID=UPI00160EA520|nr:hypothetical protein [Rhizobium sp. BK377]MBB3459901.1 hypothetical protein [Rhizobium sp. BK377]
MTFYRTTRLMLSSAAILSFAGSAFALDGQDLLKKINAAYSQQGGMVVAADSVDIDGTTVTLKNVSFKPAGGEAVSIGEVTLSGVEEQDGGSYYIEEAAFPDINSSKDGVTISASDLTLGGISVPAQPGDSIDAMLFAESAHTGAIKVTKDGMETFSVLESDMNATLREDASGFDFDGAFKSLKADLSQAGDDPASKEAIEKLALQHIQGDISMKGGWDLEPGTVDLSEISFDFTNIGKLNFGFKISGCTLAFIKSMQDAITQSEANPNKEEAQQAFGFAMLGLAQQLNFEGAQIRFEDASITKRALEYAGSKQNVSGQQMANSLKAMTPIILAQLNIPELQNAISAAVSTFLDNPKSLTMKATPDKPVAFPMIIGAAMGAPNTVPQMLGVKVSAND